MRILRNSFTLSALSLALLSGCVVGEGGYYNPAPYYGGAAPYYGTTYAPAYVGVYGGGDYYRHYSYHNIHSGYNNGYWHNQRGNPSYHGRVAAQPGGGHGAQTRSGGYNGGAHEGGHP